MGRSLHFPFWFSTDQTQQFPMKMPSPSTIQGIEEVCGTADAGSELCFLVDVFTVTPGSLVDVLVGWTSWDRTVKCGKANGSQWQTTYKRPMGDGRLMFVGLCWVEWPTLIQFIRTEKHQRTSTVGIIRAMKESTFLSQATPAAKPKDSHKSLKGSGVSDAG